MMNEESEEASSLRPLQGRAGDEAALERFKESNNKKKK